MIKANVILDHSKWKNKLFWEKKTRVLNSFNKQQKNEKFKF